MNPLIPKLNTVIDSLQEFRSQLLAAEAPPISKPVTDLVLPQATYTLPRETDSEMTKFYGKPSKNLELAWFSFPTDKVRLYSRDGVELKSVVGDSRDDHRTHPLLADRLTNALAEIYYTLGEERFFAEGWHVYGGSHNYRQKVGGSSLSTHSWALAVDISPDENPYAQKTTTFSDTAINIMEKWGFLSGGRAWGKDWMHFQAAIPYISSNSYYAVHGLPKNILSA